MKIKLQKTNHNQFYIKFKRAYTMKIKAAVFIMTISALLTHSSYAASRHKDGFDWHNLGGYSTKWGKATSYINITPGHIQNANPEGTVTSVFLKTVWEKPVKNPVFKGIVFDETWSNVFISCNPKDVPFGLTSTQSIALAYKGDLVNEMKLSEEQKSWGEPTAQDQMSALIYICDRK